VIMGERQKKWNKSKKNSIEHIPSWEAQLVKK
jgi:hypothetical protein